MVALLASLACGGGGEGGSVLTFEGVAVGESLRWIADEPTARIDLATADPDTWHGKSARVDLGHTVRPSRLAARGRGLEWSLPSAASGILELAVGLPGDVPQRIVIRRIGDEAPLVSQVVTPKEPEGDAPEGQSQWFPVRVELTGGEGGTQPLARLRFEVEVEGESEANRLVAWGDPMLSPAQDAEPTRRRMPPRHVVLVSIDTLRADRMSLYGYERETTPWLGRWAARRAVVFEDANAAASWTLPSHVSMLSGLDPLSHTIHHDIRSARGQELPTLLAERLRADGWRTAAVTGGAYLHPKYGFDHGFESYAYWPDRRRSQRELERGVDQALSWLEEHQDQRSFLFLHSYAPHDPYRARRPFFDRWAPDEALDLPRNTSIALKSEDRSVDNGFRKHTFFELRQRGERRRLELPAESELLDAFYDSGVAYVDQQVFRLLRGIDELGLRNQTLIILTSDHGEALGDRGGEAGHAKLYQHTLRVPLVMAFPDRRGAGHRLAEPVGSIDLVPTILDAVGLDLRDPDLDGRSLLPQIPHRAGDERPSGPGERNLWSYSAAPNWGLAVRRGQHKAILDLNPWRGPDDPVLELFDLETDPEELRPLGEAPENGGSLEGIATERWRSEAQGLRLRIQNPGAGTLRGELRGGMIRSVATKSLDLGCDCLSWQSIGRARFELGPGDDVTLHFEKVFGRQLEVRGELRENGTHRPFSVSFEVEEPGALAWRDGRFVEVSPEDLGEAPGLALSWIGPARIHDRSATSRDPELERQLRALGYL